MNEITNLDPALIALLKTTLRLNLQWTSGHPPLAIAIALEELAAEYRDAAAIQP